MNEVLSKLAETLDISNKGLEKLIESVGGVNYAEVYQILNREYTIYTLSKNLTILGFMVVVFVGIPTIIWGLKHLDPGYYHQEWKQEIFRKHYKKFVFVTCLGFLLITLMQFTPIFYPNVNLLLELIKE